MVRQTSLIGNALFRCPEFDESDEVCPKGDIWSFGTLILFLLSAKNDMTPFYYSPVFKLHDRVKELLAEEEDRLLKEALL